METLRFGDSGTNVELAQLGLKRANFLTSAIDGNFGLQTLTAVTEFQNFEKLETTGEVDEATWEELTPFLTGVFGYNVKPGDTLTRLAREYNTTVEELQMANPELLVDGLWAGMMIEIPLNFDVVPTDISVSSVLLEFILKGLMARYTFITMGTIGCSVLGRKIYYLEIGGGSSNVFYNASHHANEWITTTLLLKFLENYAKAIVADANIGGLRARDIFVISKITIVPLVNPDGVDLVTGALTDGLDDFARMLAENYPHIPFPSGWKANMRGVDLNLQYPADWEEAMRIKTSQGFTTPGPRDYVGDAPLTEPESRAMYEFTLERDFLLTLSYHTQGEVIYWKYKDLLPPRSWEIAQEFSRVSGYAAEETPYGSGNAGYKDWFIKETNRPGFTIEAGLGVSPLPLEQFNKIYRDNEPLLALAAIINARN